MAGHTPGPWVIGSKGVRFSDIDRRIWVVNIFGQQRVAMVEGSTEDEAGANAQIFAASLDLLAALKELSDVDAEELLDSTSEPWQRAQAAIAKATGEAQPR